MIYQSEFWTEVQRVNMYILGEPFDNTWDWSKPVKIEWDQISTTRTVSSAEIRLRFGLFDIERYTRDYFAGPTIT